MTNGLVKERLTYFHENGIAYQAFNTITGAKVLVYVEIETNKYICCAEFVVDHHINVEELKLIADEYEIAREIL